MIAYLKSYSEFHSDVENNAIENEIVSKLNMNVSESERRSFRRSLFYVDYVLQMSKMPNDVEIALEYRIPLTSRRIDFLIAGQDADGKDHVIICELKQWESVKHTDMPDIVIVGREEHVHPSWQAYSYATTLTNFNEYVEENDLDIKTCTFLHNYQRKNIDELVNPIYSEGISKARPFIQDEFPIFADFLKKYIQKPSKHNLLFEIENGRIRPSKMLANCLGELLNDQTEYNLIDRQRIVYSNLYREIHQQFKEENKGTKQVFIVRGGAGTGKSVIAMQLMTNLIKNKGKTTFYVAKSSYVKDAYFNKLTKGVPRYSYLRSLFKGSSSFIGKSLNEFDVLLVDEAHRLMKRSKQSWFYTGENQIKEIIHAAKVSVFFIDETQNIDIKDFGTIDNIKAAAQDLSQSGEKVAVHCEDKYILESQFRCNGSDEYIAWLESILYNKRFEPSGEEVDYDIRIFDDLCEMRDAIIQKNNSSTIPSRMLSGDVFNWKSMKDPNAIDIEIGEFKAQWNKSKSFATNPKSINEVGCIHTSQGMDFEYAGVIVADDIVYRDGKIQTDYTRHPVNAGEFKRPHQKKVLPEDLPQIDRIIRNTYKVLFTRGQRGCYIYVMDPALKQYLAQQIDLLLYRT